MLAARTILKRPIMRKSICFLLLAATAAFTQPATSRAAALKLWYEQPANSRSCMNEAMPIGNGRLGALIQGGAASDRIVLNEDSLWTGDENPSGDYNTMGSYQVMGELRISFPAHTNVTKYRRELELDNALASVSYEANGIAWRREYFCSHPDQVLVIRLSADKPGACTGAIELADSHRASVTADGRRLSFTGRLRNQMLYETQLLALKDGGLIQATNGTLEFRNCNSLTLLLAAGTDYVMDSSRKYRGEPPHERLSRRDRSRCRQDVR